MLEKFFKLRENNTNVKTEVMAGITTFMTMAYILAVNPNILSATGMDPQAILLATALASFLGTLMMALLANYPFALAPGMGLNAYFAYTVVIGYGYSWQIALLAVFIEGLIFIVLSEGGDFQRHSHDAEVRGECRHRLVYRLYRPAKCQDRGKQ